MLLRLALFAAVAALAAGSALNPADVERFSKLGAGIREVRAPLDFSPSGASFEEVRDRRATCNQYQFEDGFNSGYPENDATNVVGNIREFLLEGSQAYESQLTQLSATNNPNIIVQPLSGTEAATRTMSHEMLARLRALSDELTAYNLKLVLLAAYDVPTPSSRANEPLNRQLRYEGRMAYISFQRADGTPADPCNMFTLGALAWQAGFDWVFVFGRSVNGVLEYNVRVAVPSELCGADLDMAFVLDGSGSLDSQDFQDQKDFVVGVARAFQDSSSRFGVVTMHGPRVAHYAPLPDMEDCPPGTVATIEGACACAYEALCEGPQYDPNFPETTAGQCRSSNYAVKPGACDGYTSDWVPEEHPDCLWPIFFFEPSCTECSCTASPNTVTYTKEDSYDVNYLLLQSSNPDNIQAALNAYSFPGGATHLSFALEAINELIFNVENGMRPGEESIPRVLIVLTDGKSNPGFEPDSYAEILKLRGIRIFVIAVGNNVYAPEIEALATHPADRHTVHIDDAGALQHVIDRVKYLACESTSVLNPGNGTETTIGGGEFKYYVLECEVFMPAVIIHAEDIFGSTEFFISRTNSNPSPVDHDQAITVSSSSRYLRFDRGTSPVYVAALGSDEQASNQFSLDFYQDAFSQYQIFANAAEGSAGSSSVPLELVDAPTLSSNIPSGFTPSLTYYLAGDDASDFVIDRNTGVISFIGGEMDQETKAEYSLIRFARDANVLCFKPFQYVTVQVADANDNAPVFEQLQYTVTIAEDVDVRSNPNNNRRRRAITYPQLLTTVTATDSDAGTNAAVTYSIISVTPTTAATFFSIGESNGQLSLVRGINFEELFPSGGASGTITLKIAARDGGGLFAPDAATVTVTVTNENDPAVISPSAPSTVEVSSATESLTSVFNVPLVDDDGVVEAASTCCEIVESTSTFTISSTTCQILTTRDLSSNDIGQYTAQVTVTDCAGGTNDQRDFTLNVVKSNFHAPQFDSPTYAVNIARDEPANSIVLDPTVTDQDAQLGGEISPLTCTVTGGAQAALFGFFGDCQLQLVQDMPEGAPVNFEITIEVSDGELSSEAVVTLTVFNGCSPLPCKEGYACAEGLVYDCDCVSGEGVTCQIDYCAQNVGACLNGATCVNEAEGFSCECLGGFEGDDCGTAMNLCEPSPCENNGVCVRISSLGEGGPLNAFECQCTVQFYGVLCENQDTSPNKCNPNPCSEASGAVCVRVSSVPFGPKDDYECQQCPAPLSGKNCDTCPPGTFGDFDGTTFCPFESSGDCESSPCQGGGTCVPVSTDFTRPPDEFICQCPEGLAGTLCERAAACTNGKCGDHGTCTELNESPFFECTCAEGFSGSLCGESSSNCDGDNPPLPCAGGAECVATVYGGACDCECPFTGFQCEVKGSSSSCSTTGNPCQTNPCVAPSTCVAFSSKDPTPGQQPVLDDYRCDNCPSNRKGKNCNECIAGKTGPNCDQDDTSPDPCSTNPCNNGGTCFSTQKSPDEERVAFCICPENTAGDRCQETTEECDNGNLVCLNGGQCVPSRRGGECSCPPCFTGSTCSREVTNCNQQNAASSSGGDNTALLGGVVAGGIVALVIIGALIMFLRGRNKDPAVGPVGYTSTMNNPTFVNPNGGGQVDTLDNPMYGLGAGEHNGTYAGNYSSGYDQVAPGGGAVYDSARAFGAPKGRGGDGGYLTVQGGGNGGHDAMSNPMYFTGGQGGNDTYDTSMLSPNQNLQVDRGSLRLASVARSNPLNAGGVSNPMYNTGMAHDAPYDTASDETQHMYDHASFGESTTDGPVYDSASGF